MSKITDYLLKDDVIVVMDVDGVLAPYEFSELSHSMTDDEWDRLVASGENPYKDVRPIKLMQEFIQKKTSVYKGYKQDKIEMRGDRAEMSDFPLYLNTVAGGLDRRDQTIGGFSFVVKIYAVPVVEIIGQLLYLLGRYGFNAQFGDCL